MSKVLQLAVRSKCSGCLALINKTEKFECKLGYPIDFSNLESGQAIAPKPKTGIRCYKPRCNKSLKAALSHLSK